MTQWVDRPKPIRKGEELDQQALEHYLKANIPDLDGELVIEQFPRGFSNLTYLLRVGEREMVMRRPPFGANIKSAHDMGREYRVLSNLNPVYSKAPRPLAYCEDESVLGAPFYVMERVRGVILRAQMPKEMIPAPPLMRQIGESLVDELVTLHGIDWQAVGLGDFGRPEGYVARQVFGWTKRYNRAKTDDIPDMEHAAQWLADNMPLESGASLIHNDFKYDNFVLDPTDWTNIIAILDWEMATIGDPLLDLGTSISYWVQADDPPIMAALALSPTTLPGNLTRAEVVQRYAAKSGRNVDNIVFYYVYGLFKLGVIVQQIYTRWKLGYTKDERFAGLIGAVKACGAMATRTIQTQTL